MPRLRCSSTGTISPTLYAPHSADSSSAWAPNRNDVLSLTRCHDDHDRDKSLFGLRSRESVGHLSVARGFPLGANPAGAHTVPRPRTRTKTMQLGGSGGGGRSVFRTAAERCQYSRALPILTSPARCGLAQLAHAHDPEEGQLRAVAVVLRVQHLIEQLDGRPDARCERATLLGAGQLERLGLRIWCSGRGALLRLLERVRGLRSVDCWQRATATARRAS